MMITIDPEDVRLSKRERDFLRTIALKLQSDAQRRWQDLPEGSRAAITEVFGVCASREDKTKSAFLIARPRGAKKAG